MDGLQAGGAAGLLAVDVHLERGVALAPDDLHAIGDVAQHARVQSPLLGGPLEAAHDA